jgi:hypothetical protein
MIATPGGTEEREASLPRVRTTAIAATARLEARPRRRCRVERGILAQDALLELTQRSAGLEAKLVPQSGRSATVLV